MSIALSTRTVSYTAAGGETSFAVPFKVLAAGDLAVWRRRAGVETQLVLGSDYLVSGIGGAGATVLLASGATAGDVIVADGARRRERLTNLDFAQGFRASAVNTDLDQLQIQVQELAREQLRSLRGRPTYPVDARLPVPQANAYLGWNEDGTAIENKGGMNYRGAWASGAVYDVDDTVTRAGSTWIARTDHTASAANAPDANTLAADAAWDKIAAAGDAGPAGPNTGLDYRWDAGTAGAPGSGHLSINNAAPMSATQLSIHITDRLDTSNQALIVRWGASTSTNKGTLRVLDLANRANWAEFIVTAAPVLAGSVMTVNVTPVAAAGTLADEAIVAVVFSATGDAGGVAPTGVVADVATRAAALVLSPDGTVAGIRLAGRNAAGDKGGGLYVRVGSAPSHAGFFQTANGVYFELAEASVRPEMFGAFGGTTDDTAAMQAAVTYCVAKGATLVPSAKTSYRATGLIATGFLRIMAEPGAKFEEQNGSASTITFQAGCDVSGLAFDGRNLHPIAQEISPGVTNTRGPVACFGLGNYFFDECTFTGIRKRAVHCDEYRAVWFYGCDFSGAVGHTGVAGEVQQYIYSAGGASSASISVLWVDACTFDGSGVSNPSGGPGGVFLADSARPVQLIATRCAFNKMGNKLGGNFTAGIDGYVQADGTIVTDCVADNYVHTAFKFSGSGSVRMQGLRIIKPVDDNQDQAVTFQPVFDANALYKGRAIVRDVIIDDCCSGILAATNPAVEDSYQLIIDGVLIGNTRTGSAGNGYGVFVEGFRDWIVRNVLIGEDPAPGASRPSNPVPTARGAAWRGIWTRNNDGSGLIENCTVRTKLGGDQAFRIEEDGACDVKYINNNAVNWHGSIGTLVRGCRTFRHWGNAWRHDSAAGKVGLDIAGITVKLQQGMDDFEMTGGTPYVISIATLPAGGYDNGPFYVWSRAGVPNGFFTSSRVGQEMQDSATGQIWKAKAAGVNNQWAQIT